VRFGLAAFLLATMASDLALEAHFRFLHVWDFVPLHLCDASIFVAMYALLTRRPLATEVLYYWTGAGTTLAMVTPDLAWAFPHWRFIVYFALHGGVVAAAAVLVFGCGIRPGPPWRAFAALNAYALAVGAVNAVFGTNFLYLCRKPSGTSPLDWFGPWPAYLVVAEVVALGLFGLLYLPFRRREGSKTAPPSNSDAPDPSRG
jgi:hypothetical integral membrane protein (TIGR02206 family)